jgi:hypothetical protein
MSWNKLIRQVHRWLSIIFVAVVAGIFVALGFGVEPVAWVYYVPLAPLVLLMASGLYLFVLPYVLGWQSGRRAGGEA